MINLVTTLVAIKEKPWNGSIHGCTVNSNHAIKHKLHIIIDIIVYRFDSSNYA